MREDTAIQPTRRETIIWRSSLFVGGLAAANGIFALLANWAVIAGALEGRGVGIPIAAGIVMFFSELAGGIAALVLVFLAGGVAFAHRRAAMLLAAAAVVSALPVVFFWR
jgi:hypothetical protein